MDGLDTNEYVEIVKGDGMPSIWHQPKFVIKHNEGTYRSAIDIG